MDLPQEIYAEHQHSYQSHATTACPHGCSMNVPKVRRPQEVAIFLKKFEVKHRGDVINNLLTLGLRHYQMLTDGEADAEKVKHTATRVKRIPAPVPSGHAPPESRDYHHLLKVPLPKSQEKNPGRKRYMFEPSRRTQSAHPTGKGRHHPNQNGHNHADVGANSDLTALIAERRRRLRSDPHRDKTTVKDWFGGNPDFRDHQSPREEQRQEEDEDEEPPTARGRSPYRNDHAPHVRNEATEDAPRQQVHHARPEPVEEQHQEEPARTEGGGQEVRVEGGGRLTVELEDFAVARRIRNARLQASRTRFEEDPSRRRHMTSTIQSTMIPQGGGVSRDSTAPASPSALSDTVVFPTGNAGHDNHPQSALDLVFHSSLPDRSLATATVVTSARGTGGGRPPRSPTRQPRNSPPSASTPPQQHQPLPQQGVGMAMSNEFLDTLEHHITHTRGQRQSLAKLGNAMPDHVDSFLHEAFPRLYRTMLTSYHSRAGVE